MADKIDFQLKEDGDILNYQFKIKDSLINLDIVEFKGVEDYEQYLEEGDENIFTPLKDYLNEMNRIAFFDWEFEIRKEIDIFKLIRMVEVLCKDYVLRKSPDVIAYEAKNPKLHRIYERLFPSFGYRLEYSIGDDYVYTKFGNETIKIIPE